MRRCEVTAEAHQFGDAVVLILSCGPAAASGTVRAMAVRNLDQIIDLDQEETYAMAHTLATYRNAMGCDAHGGVVRSTRSASANGR